MSSHHLPVFLANASDDAEELQPLVLSGHGGGEGVSRFSKCLRISAIASLLLGADSAPFRSDLAASARGLKTWLERAGSNGRDGLGLSRCAGFFDAIAAEEWGLAADLARALAHAAWDPEGEYEEDYLYTKLLMSRVGAGDAENDARAALLARYRELEGDEVDWRLELCTALEEGNELAFEEALEGLMLAERDEMEYLRAKEALLPEELATLGCVSIEGIALHRLGTRAGFRLQRDYLFIPSLALDPPLAE
ncbi:MAG TPA: Imm49 family immunity protein [Gammaproteobacteria bacterium]|nr:Imm49 family immunity protein [Gammaproteobacteria bacterium]